MYACVRICIRMHIKLNGIFVSLYFDISICHSLYQSNDRFRIPYHNIFRSLGLLQQVKCPMSIKCNWMANSKQVKNLDISLWSLINGFFTWPSLGSVIISMSCPDLRLATFPKFHYLFRLEVIAVKILIHCLNDPMVTLKTTIWRNKCFPLIISQAVSNYMGVI